MDALRMTTTAGTRAKVEGEAVAALRASLRGELLTRESPGYDGARRVWNAMIDRRPGLVVRCAGAADVLRAVDFARRHRLLLAVRGGGHGIAGHAVCDGGLMIDLSPMKSVRVDPDRRHAFVEPGATLADFDHEAQAFALATPLGIASTTGVAGLTLGGGFGWLSRRYGLAVDNLVGADVVTAAGRLVHASAGEHPDLFWGLTGGGGNFGVVTSFEFRLHPVGPEVLAGVIAFPLEAGRAVLAALRELGKHLADDTTVWAILRAAPPLPFLPAAIHGRPVVILALCHVGDVKSGEHAIAALRGMGAAAGEAFDRQPFAAWQRAFDPLLAPGARNYWKAHNLAELADGAIEVALDYAQKLPSPQCEIFFGMLGGAVARRPADATAYSHRDAWGVMNVHARWDRAAEDEACIGWARALFADMAPYAGGGVYVNFLAGDESDRTAQAYDPRVWPQLVAVKSRWDPDNLFRMNQNIAPSAGADS